MNHCVQAGIQIWATDEICHYIEFAVACPFAALIRSGSGWNYKSRFKSKLFGALQFISGSGSAERNRIHCACELQGGESYSTSDRVDQHTFIWPNASLNPQR